MEIQEQLAVEYLFESIHKEEEYTIVLDFYIRKGFVIKFNWEPLEVTKELIPIHQN